MILDTPLLFLVYNRPSITNRVFSEIRNVRPKKLYLAADGPKDIYDKNNTDKTRAIIDNIDWKCNVKKLYRDQNLGCKNSVKNAIDWFFNEEDYGIILEDDCYPNKSTFKFFNDLLIQYSSSNKIMHISGVNYQRKPLKINSSYYFSSIANINGWATWRETWLIYDDIFDKFEDFKKNNKIKKIFTQKIVQNYWMEVFERNYKGEDSSWSWPYLFSLFNNEGLAINQSINLISNIGYGSQAVHTKNPRDKLANLPVFNIEFPLIHPKDLKPNYIADYETNKIFYKITIFNYGIKKILKKIRVFSIVKSLYNSIIKKF